MGLISLREATGQLQPNYTKAAIQAGLRTPQGAHRVWIVVEDTDDVNVYERFFNPLHTKVLTSEDQDGKNGCAHVEAIVTEIIEEEAAPFIFGIRDTDYTKYEAEAYEFPPSVFHTDHRDVEMMMISAPSVRNSLTEWNENLLIKIREGEPVTRLMGYMRICNHIHRLGCAFKKKVKVSMVWDQTSHSLVADWKNILLSKFLENCNNPFTSEEFEATIESKSLENEDSLDICQGHDVVRLLQYMMIRNEFNEVGITKRMTMAYSIDDFKNTQLYTQISAWATHREAEVFYSFEE